MLVDPWLESSSRPIPHHEISFQLSFPMNVSRFPDVDRSRHFTDLEGSRRVWAQGQMAMGIEEGSVFAIKRYYSVAKDPKK